MKFKKCLLPVAMLASFTLAGCQSNADDHAADVDWPPESPDNQYHLNK